MAFLVLGANSVSGYTVKNSLRFNSGSSDYLSKNFASAGTRTKWTYSFWIKRTKLSVNQNVTGVGGGSYQENVIFTDSDSIDWQSYQNAMVGQLVTTRKFRDIGAWYHIVLVWDTTNATAGDRMRIYVNGTEETSFTTDINPSSNLTSLWNNSGNNYIGQVGNSVNFIDCYMADTYFIDGQALTPSSFGETDTDTGIWKPKAYTGTYGTNGFYLKFANSASLGTDSSGNGNTFTVNNLTSVDQSTDTPTNNFCTGNPLFAHNNTPTFSNGNLTIVTATADSTVIGNFGLTTGKWYFEAKIGSTAVGAAIGIIGDIENIQNTGSNLTFYPQGFALYVDGRKYNNNVGTLYGSSYTTGDIIGVAFDLTNGKIWFSKNGTWQNSGDPVAGTNAAFTTLSSTVTYFPAFGDASGGSTSTFDCNFGSPPYSANSYTDSAGFGNFSYSVPSGFFSLNTKNLAQYG
jgi:hypothetical protein